MGDNNRTTSTSRKQDFKKSNADEENWLLLTKKKSTKKTFNCYQCGKIGHLKKDGRNFLQKKSNSETSAASEKSTTEKCATAKGDEKLISLFATALAVISDENNKWIIDRGATRHMAYDKRSFSTLEALKEKITIEIGDGSTINAEAVGKVELTLNLPNGDSKQLIADDILFIPKVFCNLLSVARITETGRFVNFNKCKCEILDKCNQLLAVGNKVGKFYYLDCNKKETTSICSEDQNVLWHQRFCHLGQDNLHKLVTKDLVTGMNFCQQRNYFVKIAVKVKFTGNRFQLLIATKRIDKFLNSFILMFVAK